MEINIPKTALVMLVGVSGSGKSSFAKNIFPNTKSFLRIRAAELFPTMKTIRLLQAMHLICFIISFRYGLKTVCSPLPMRQIFKPPHGKSCSISRALFTFSPSQSFSICRRSCAKTEMRCARTEPFPPMSSGGRCRI